MSLNRKRKQNDFEKIFDLDPAEKESEQKVITPEAAEKSRKRKSLLRKILVIALPVIIVVAVAVILTVHSVNNSGYRLQIQNTLDAITAGDATALCENLSAISYGGLTYEQFLPVKYLTVKTEMDSFVDGLEDSSGKIDSVKFKVINSDKLSKDEISDLLSETTAEGTDPSVSASDIDEIKRVDLRLTVSGDKFITTYVVYNVYMVNEKGQWKTYFDTNELQVDQLNQEYPKK